MNALEEIFVINNPSSDMTNNDTNVTLKKQLKPLPCKRKSARK